MTLPAEEDEDDDEEEVDDTEDFRSGGAVNCCTVVSLEFLWPSSKTVSVVILPGRDKVGIRMELGEGGVTLTLSRLGDRRLELSLHLREKGS